MHSKSKFAQTVALQKRLPPIFHPIERRRTAPNHDFGPQSSILTQTAETLRKTILRYVVVSNITHQLLFVCVGMTLRDKFLIPLQSVMSWRALMCGQKTSSKTATTPVAIRNCSRERVHARLTTSAERTSQRLMRLVGHHFVCDGCHFKGSWH